MLQTYGAVGKCGSLSCEGMMIEYTSTVILPGCGPEVCVTSNNTQHRLRRHTDEGQKRRGAGGGEIWKQHGSRKREEGKVTERQTERVCGESYPFKRLICMVVLS